MVLDNLVLLDVVYEHVALNECVNEILATVHESGWTIEIDDRLPNFSMAAFTPQYVSVHHALQQLAEAYLAELTIHEDHKIIRFDQKPQLSIHGRNPFDI